MGNMIALDTTLWIQLVNFLITIVVLNYLLIKPVRAHIAARKALTAGYAADVEKFTAEANQKLASYETSLSHARTEASVDRDALKAEGHSREQALLQAAQAEAQSFLTAHRAQVAKDAKTAGKALLSQVDSFAAKAMTKILG